MEEFINFDDKINISIKNTKRRIYKIRNSIFLTKIIIILKIKKKKVVVVAETQVKKIA